MGWGNKMGKCFSFVGCAFAFLGDVNCRVDGVCIFHFDLKN